MTHIRRLAEAIRREVPRHLIPPDSDDLFLIYAALASSKAEAVSAQDVHDAWIAWMEMHGRVHPSMVPFSELPDSVQREDNPFVAAIRAAVKKTSRAYE